MKLDQIFSLECLENEVREPFSDTIRNEYGVSVQPIPDGNIHRFDIDRRSDKVGWYVLFEELDFSCGVYGNWKTGEQHRWSSSSNLSEEQHYRLEVHMAKIEHDAEEEQKRVAVKAESIYSDAAPAKEDHPYLQTKKVGADRFLAQSGDRLVLPLLDRDFNVVSLQYISPDGRKQFLKGGRTSGCFCPIGMPDDYTGPVFMAEGYATAMSVHEATGRPCIVAFNAGNLPKVAEALKDTWDITVVADNDESKTGEKYAKATELPYKLIPRVGMDANDYVNAGYDLGSFLVPTPEQKGEWLLNAQDFVDSYKPSSWMIKNWIPAHGMVMLYGAPASGKTFVALDMLLTISTGQGDWFGNKTKTGNVVYLAGEGHEGLRKRLKVWQQERHVDSFGHFAIAQSALDLDSAQGLQDTADSIDALPFCPNIIAIDTLNRFFSGDENSAQETRGFIESCTELQNRYNCTVIIIHHTGVSETAQNRARGSSALKGAVDTEILVKKEEDGLLTLTQTKQKDIDMMPDMSLALKGHVISGWVDEDNEPLTSATLEEPNKEDRKKALESELSIIEQAYKYSEKLHDEDDYPMITRGDLKEALRARKKKESDIKNWMRTEKNRPIGKLIDAGIIKENGSGWTIIDLDEANILVLEEME